MNEVLKPQVIESLPNMEIERKFVLSALPEGIEGCPATQIRQGYLEISPDGSEVRIRHKRKDGVDEYILTHKSGKGVSRTESESAITEAEFNELWLETEGKRVEKTRYEIQYEKYVIEVDVYSGELEGLLTAEVEFDSPEEAGDFEPPEWFGTDVTQDHRYKNQQLATLGDPRSK